MTEINILAVNISEEKGTIKHPVKEIIFNNKGIKNDAHSGNWHRQVSLLGVDSIKKFADKAKREIGYGEFAENVTTEGMKIYKAKILDKFINSTNELEVTQIGKKCHGTGCNIYQEVGNCIMPKEGIFCRVIKGKSLKAGDKLTYIQRVFKIGIIALKNSDSSNNTKILMQDFFNSINREIEIKENILQKNFQFINASINKFSENNFDIIFTIGCNNNDSKNKSENTLSPIFDNDISNIIEKIRLKSRDEKLHPYVIKSISQVKDKTLIFSLPDNINKVIEYITEINKILVSGIYVLNGL